MSKLVIAMLIQWPGDFKRKWKSSEKEYLPNASFSLNHSRTLLEKL